MRARWVTCEVARATSGDALEVHDASQLAAVQASARRGGGVYLGAAPGGLAFSGHGRSTLVLGPTRAGKTTSIIIPNVLAWPGAVVATSTKRELLDATLDARAAMGSVHLFDPSGTVAVPRGVHRVGWSPTDASASFDAALHTATTMVDASVLTAGAMHRSADHWSERSSAVLATMLHAAALGELGVRQVLEWVDRHDGEEALDLLSTHPGASPHARALLEGIVATDHRELSAIWSTTSGVLGAYRSEAVLASTEGPRTDLGRFVTSTDAIYLCAPGQRQLQFAPLLVGLMGALREHCYAAATTSAPEVLLCLDEAANIAPLPELPNLVSEGGGQGITSLVCLQDLSQARLRWGREADAFLSLFPVTVVLPGIADLPTLEALSKLGGEHDMPRRSFSINTTARSRSRSHSVHLEHVRRHPVDALARGQHGHAMVLGPTKVLTAIELTPSHRQAPWCELRGDLRQRTHGRAR